MPPGEIRPASYAPSNDLSAKAKKKINPYLYGRVRDDAMDRTSNGAELTPGEQRLFNEYVGKLKEAKLDPEDFPDVYSVEDIKGDMSWVDQLRKGESPKTPQGELLEAMLFELAELYDWFGENFSLVATSEYDDRKAHGDLVMEIESDSGEIMRLLIDVASGVDNINLREKMDRGVRQVEKGLLNSVKYFQSERDETKGRISDLPRVVIGMNPDSLRGLVDDILVNGKKSLNNHIAMFKLLDEMVFQLNRLAKLSLDSNGTDHKATRVLNGLLKEIRLVLDKKENLRDPNFGAKVKKDRTYDLLTS